MITLTLFSCPPHYPLYPLIVNMLHRIPRMYSYCPDISTSTTLAVNPIIFTLSDGLLQHPQLCSLPNTVFCIWLLFCLFTTIRLIIFGNLNILVSEQAVILGT